MLDSLEIVLEADKNEKESSELLQQRSIRQHGLEFHENHGKNVQLKSNNTTAIRTYSYNQGMLLTNHPLKEKEIFEVKLDILEVSKN